MKIILTFNKEVEHEKGRLMDKIRGHWYDHIKCTVRTQSLLSSNIYTLFTKARKHFKLWQRKNKIQLMQQRTKLAKMKIFLQW